MRPKADDDWRRRAMELFADGHRGPSAIRQLREENGGIKPLSDRQIYRYLDDYRKLPEDLRRELSTVRYPDAMLDRSLPWEASRAVLDLLAARGPAERPTVGHARWYWRVQEASPSIPRRLADVLAQELATQDYVRLSGSTGGSSLPALELLLMYEPWADEDHERAYNEVAQRLGNAPYPTIVKTSHFNPEDPALQFALATRFGDAVAREMAEQHREAVALLARRDLSDEERTIEIRRIYRITDDEEASHG